MANREKVLNALENCTAHPKCRDCGWKECEYEHETVEIPLTLAKDAHSLLEAQEKKWIPFVKRPLTEEEKRNHPEWCFILDGEVPDDDQEILLYRPWKNKDGFIIEMDRYMDNGDTVYLEGAMDIENGMYWMPLPEPPKER